MTNTEKLLQALQAHFHEANMVYVQDITFTCALDTLVSVLSKLKDDALFQFDQLIDVTAVDYLRYGQSDWETDEASAHGFSRAAEPTSVVVHTGPRFAVVYHLLSTVHNHRVRVKAFVEEATPVVPSVHMLWKSANWYEREVYDLFGILFDGHPDLRRILTDYGFVGHPFRKDFPLSGHVEMRYDAAQQKVIYEPVDIVPRVTVPRVIREDNRYLDKKEVCRD